MATFSQTATINAPIEEVFAVISNPILIPKWRTDVPAITEISGSTKAGTTFTEEVNFMGRKKLRMKVTDFEPNKKLVIAAQEGMSILPTQHFIFSAQGTSTQVQLDVDLQVSGVMKLFAPLFPPKFKKIWAGYFENLNAYLNR